METNSFKPLGFPYVIPKVLKSSVSDKPWLAQVSADTVRLLKRDPDFLGDELSFSEADAFFYCD